MLYISPPEQFIEKARKVHGNKYNYDKINYTGALNKVIITCKKHGDFEQTPGNHIYGQGCKQCYIKNKTFSNTQFIKKARAIHGSKYNYSKTNYINAKSSVIITCQKHGDFIQNSNDHLKGRGCTKCNIENKTISLEKFILRANILHNNKYNYSKVNYKHSHKKVIIICSKHGEFLQTPHNHLQGQGCSICKASKGELTLAEIFDKHNIKYESQYKLPEIVANYKIDFYLPDHNLLIEFHGIQHFEYNSFLHKNNEDNFLKQKDRDIMVRDAAIRFKYKYLEFNYKQFEELSKEEFEKLVIKKIKIS